MLLSESVTEHSCLARAEPDTTVVGNHVDVGQAIIGGRQLSAFVGLIMGVASAFSFVDFADWGKY